MSNPLAVSLRGMRFHTLVGILPHEQSLAQPLEVDLTAWTDAPVHAPLDYRALYDATAAVVAERHGYLEELASALAERTLAIPAVQRVEVAVRKPHVALPGPLLHAEVRLERQRPERATRGELAYIALGSNLGDRAAQLRAAREAIAALDGCTLLAATEVEETAPLGPAGQGPYLNQMVAVETTLQPLELLDALQRLEERAGRVRTDRWGPRTLDLDIVRFGPRTIHEPRLVVPHPELPRRDFWQRELHALEQRLALATPSPTNEDARP